MIRFIDVSGTEHKVSWWQVHSFDPDAKKVSLQTGQTVFLSTDLDFEEARRAWIEQIPAKGHTL